VNDKSGARVRERRLDTVKGRSHIRCALLRSASKTQETFYQRGVRVNAPFRPQNVKNVGQKIKKNVHRVSMIATVYSWSRPIVSKSNSDLEVSRSITGIYDTSNDARLH